MHAVRLPVRAMAAAAWVLFALVAGAAAPGVVGAGAEEPNGYVNRRDGKDQGLGAAVSGVIPITTENYEQTVSASQPVLLLAVCLYLRAKVTCLLCKYLIRIPQKKGPKA